jgi:DNA topoisomerase I
VVLDAYLDQSLHEIMAKHMGITVDGQYTLRAEEIAVIALIEAKQSTQSEQQ